MNKTLEIYKSSLIAELDSSAMNSVPLLTDLILTAWKNGNNIFLCGNGGSAGNAIHIANDFIYGAGKANGKGIRVEALSANPAVITCLANDVGYDYIFSEQIKVKGNEGDMLIVLSGSGNSSNVVQAINVANSLGMKTVAILGYDGGECKKIAQLPIHFEIKDMQIAEDLQLIILHMCMKLLQQKTFIVSKI
jgi:D-sedoheptulose 7-phosphate isomerase